MTDEIEILRLRAKVRDLEDKLHSAKRSAAQYKLLYEKERDCPEDKVVLRETDRTKLITHREYIDNLLERWERIDKTDGRKEEG